ncbi:MAG TPA: OmpH family outer membrane protein [Croceibacterium sp.]|nr:OmpH family outer membrane protein [Croceibacterium sp.]
MKRTLIPAFSAALALAVAAPAALVSTPVAAQAVKGIGVVNVPAVIANSNAYKTAEQQRPTTYKAQYDTANAKRTELQNQLKPLVDKFNADRAAANPNQQSLQQQAATIQQREQDGNRELQQILAPVALSQAYVQEQLSDKLPTAIENAAKKKAVTLVVSPDNILYADAAYNLNQDVLDQLNTLLPSAQLVPPQGWLPRELREQQAAQQQQQAAAGQQAPAAAAPAQPSGR